MKQIKFVIEEGFNKMDFDTITHLLSDTYWSKGISKQEVVKGASNSALVVGVFNEAHEQIAYSRVISDKTRFAYVLDVIVDEAYRKQGVGQAMVNFILTHPELDDVYQWLLITKDAHGVYQKVGFGPVKQPGGWMEIRNERPDR